MYPTWPLFPPVWCGRFSVALFFPYQWTFAPQSSIEGWGRSLIREWGGGGERSAGIMNSHCNPLLPLFFWNLIKKNHVPAQFYPNRDVSCFQIIPQLGILAAIPGSKADQLQVFLSLLPVFTLLPKQPSSLLSDRRWEQAEEFGGAGQRWGRTSSLWVALDWCLSLSQMHAFCSEWLS